METTAPIPSPPSRPPRKKGKLKRLIIVLIVFGSLGYGVNYLIKRAEKPLETVYTGYVVSYNLYQSASVSGQLDALLVKRGQMAEAGAPLFRMNSETATANVQRLEKRILELQAVVEQDKSTINRAEANLKVTDSDIEKAKLDFDRYTEIQNSDKGAISQQTVDHARITYENSQKVYAAQQEDVRLAQAKLSSTQEQINQAREDLVVARRQLTELAGYSPVKARVEDTFYQSGEWVAANSPIVSLVPLDQVKVRFYVPQGEVASFPSGTEVLVSYDGAPESFTATVDYISTRPEYTPPVIYSLQTRDKLVFLVEAVPAPDHASGLIVGQPLDVRPIKENPPVHSEPKP